MPQKATAVPEIGGTCMRRCKRQTGPLQPHARSSLSSAASSAGIAMTLARRAARSGSRRLPAGSSESLQSARSSSKNVDVARKLPMLKAVVEDVGMSAAARRIFVLPCCIGFGQQARVVALRSNVDRHVRRRARSAAARRQTLPRFHPGERAQARGWCGHSRAKAHRCAAPSRSASARAQSPAASCRHRPSIDCRC